MKKRIYGVIAALLAIVMVLGGCSSAGGKSGSSSDVQSSRDAAGDVSDSAKENAADEQKTDADTSNDGSGASGTGELTKIVMVYPCEAPADQQMVVDEINKITEAQIGVTIETIPINFSNYANQLNLMLTSNEQIDLFAVPANLFTSFASAGHLLDIGDLLKTDGQGIVDVIGETYLEAGKVNGIQYAVTTNRDLAKGFGFGIVNEIAERNNIDVASIKTLEDMTAALAIIKENEPDIVPFVADVSMPPSVRLSDVDQLGDTYGVLMNKGETLDVVNYFETDEYKNLVNTFRDWYKKGYISEDHVTSNANYTEAIKAGMGFSYIQTTKPGIDKEESNKVGKDITVVTIVDEFATTTAPQTLQWTIANKSQYPEATMRFMNLMYTSADIMNLFAWGIEGVHYVVLDDGQIDYPEGVDATNSGYNLRRGWSFGNQFLTWIWEGDSPNLWEEMDSFNKNAQVSKAFGFTFDSTDVQTEYASVTNVVNEYRAALEFGLLDPETALDEYNQKLKDAGLNRIIEAKQAQLDAWAAQNGK